jgi:hypothetical protein
MTTSKNGRKAPLPVKSARAKAPVTPAKKGAAGTEAHPAKVNKKEKLVREPQAAHQEERDVARRHRGLARDAR